MPAKQCVPKRYEVRVLSLTLIIYKEEGVHINNQERVEKYKKENCSRCKNRKEFECDIRVFQSEDAICTKCINYERED